MREPVGVVGLGVVGGTAATALEQAGVPVHVYDPYLDVGGPQELGACGVVFLCVPTPGRAHMGFDLSEVWRAAHDIGPHVSPDAVVAVKSTVPPGTNDRLAAAFPKIEFASVPEFLVAARPLETFTQPDRVVLGVRSHDAAERLTAIANEYAPGAPVIILRPIEAELAKLCANALLGAKVALANELSDVCAGHAVSWGRVQAAVGLDRRIGPDHLTVSERRGFGGACLPKDLDGLIAAARGAGRTPELLTAIAEYNRSIRVEGARDASPNGKARRAEDEAGRQARAAL